MYLHTYIYVYGYMLHSKLSSERASHLICQVLTIKDTATHCNTLQHTATHCNTLQHTACPTSIYSSLICQVLTIKVVITLQHVGREIIQRPLNFLYIAQLTERPEFAVGVPLHNSRFQRLVKMCVEEPVKISQESAHYYMYSTQ